MGEGAEALQPCFAALIDIALAICAGGLLWRRFLARDALAGALSLGLIATLAGLAGSLWAEAAAMSGAEGVAAWQAVPLMLTQTAYGHAALLGALAWCVFLFAFLVRRRFAAWPIVAWCALALVCVARAASGHANDAGWGGYAVWVHALHIAAGCVWVGTVILAAGKALSWRSWAVPERVEFARNISRAATLALATVAASGAVNTWRMLGEAGISLNDNYTALLAAKLACVGLAVCMGGYNRWRVMPVLMEKGAAKRFATVLLAEGAVLLGVMLLAAKLGSAMPPM
ncbi:MAG TPA: CopD family protein [Burkholderiaceae bacterium]